MISGFPLAGGRSEHGFGRARCIAAARRYVTATKVGRLGGRAAWYLSQQGDGVSAAGQPHVRRFRCLELGRLT
jgi:hypothetical protein